jgi:arylsulfatase A-like enzyme
VALGLLVALVALALRVVPASARMTSQDVLLLVLAAALGVTVLAEGFLDRLNPKTLPGPRQLLRLVATSVPAALVAQLVVLRGLRKLGPRDRGAGWFGFVSAALALLWTVLAARSLAGARLQGGLLLGTAGAATLATGLTWWLFAHLGRRTRALLFAIAAIAPLATRALLGPPELNQVVDAPNVLLIVLDTVRADHLELYGYERATMPELAAFAARGTTYTRCLAEAPWTLPTHASLFTGLAPPEHGAQGGASGSKQPGLVGGRALAEEHETLAEVLGAQGYASAAVVANWSFLRPRYGLHQGFDRWDARPGYRGLLAGGHLPLLLRASQVLDASALRVLQRPLEWLDAAQVSYRRADRITDEAIALLEGRLADPGRPYFLFLNYFDSHEPYLAPPGHEFPSPLAGGSRLRMGLHGSGHSREFRSRHLASLYDAELSFLDGELGRLLSHVERTGELDHTVVVIVGDHGESLWERERWGHGHSLYQSELWVPLVLWEPGGPPGGRSDAPRQLADLMPWILERVGGALPQASRRDPDLQVSQVLGRFDPGPEGGQRSDVYMVREGRHKLIAEASGSELYDLERDPEERHDLAASAPERVAQLEARLAEWRSGGDGQADDARSLDEEERRRLEALGYVE